MALAPVDVAGRPVVEELLQRAAEGLSGRRGGDALLDTWIGAQDARAALSALERAIAPAVLHVVLSDRADALGVAWMSARIGHFAVWVAPESRHVGLGPNLAQDAIDWLDSMDAEEIDALALPGDREMKNVLERSGFKARLLTLRRSS